MNRKIKGIALGVLSALMIVTGGGALAACTTTGSDIRLPEYHYDYEKAEDFGDGVKLDGVLDEEVWKNARALTAEIRNTPATYKMTSFFGAKGVYFGFDIDDEDVYFNRARNTAINSGVEFLVTTPEKNITYEVDVNAGGKTAAKKHNGSQFLPWFTDLTVGIKTDGAVNGDCKGYTIELYLPYAYFNADGADTPRTELFVNPAIIRAANDHPDDNWSERLWYSIGEQEFGLNWGPMQSSWLSFQKDKGLNAYDVKLDDGGHGTLTGRDYCIPGNAYNFSVQADEGYYLDSLLFGGIDVTDSLVYSEGIASYSGPAAENLEIKAKFEQFPSEKYTLSGTVSGEAGSELAGLRMYAVSNASKPVEIPVTGGNYTVELPAADWTVYCSANGYLTIIDTVEIYENTTKNFSFMRDFITADTPANWDFSELGNGTVRMKSGGEFLGAWHKTIKGTKAFVSANIVLPMTPGSDLRAGFAFKTDSHYTFVTLKAQGENGASEYHVEVMHDGWNWGGWNNADNRLETFVGQEVTELVNGNGLPMSVLYDAGKISVWINGKEVVHEATATNASLGFTEDAEVIPGLMTATGSVIYHNVEFNTVGYDNGYPVNITKSGRGKVEVAKRTFTPGETVTFTITPNEGYMLSKLAVNGKSVIADATEDETTGVYTLEVQTEAGLAVISLDVSFVRVLEANCALSGKVTAAGENLEEIEVVLVNTLTGQTYTEFTANGAYLFDAIPAGIYKLYVNRTVVEEGVPNENFVKGYTSYEEEILVNGSLVRDIALAVFTATQLYVQNPDSAEAEMYDFEQMPVGEYHYGPDGLVIGDVTGDIEFVYDGPVVEANYFELPTQFRASWGDNFTVSMNLRKQDSFDLSVNGRYGIIVRNGGWWLGFTITWEIQQSGDPAVNFSVFNWDSGIWEGRPLTAEERAAWESEEGFTFSVTRIGDYYNTYAKHGDAWDLLHSKLDYNTSLGNYREGSSRPVRISLAAWTPQKGAEYRNFSWHLGDTPFTAEATTQENVAVSFDRESYNLGDDVEITFTPQPGYAPQEVLVNGQNVTANLTKEGSVFKYTVQGFTASTKLAVSAKFIQTDSVGNVTVTLKLHKFGSGEGNLCAVPEGTVVELKGALSYTANAAADGTVTFEDVNVGQYTLKVAGYLSKTIDVGREATAFEETLEYDLVKEKSDAFNTEKMNDGEIAVTSDAAAQKLWFNETIANDLDFFYQTTLKDAVTQNVQGGSARFGLVIGWDRDSNGLWDVGVWGSDTEPYGETLHFTICAEPDGSVVVQWLQRKEAERGWNVYAFTAEQKAALTTGLTVGVARVDGKYFFLIGSGTAEGGYTAIPYNDNNWAFNNLNSENPLMIGLWSEHNQGQGVAVKFTNTKVETFAEGIGEELQKALALTLNKEAVTGATVTLNENAYFGANITLTFTPEAGKVPSSVKIGETEYLGRLLYEDGKYLLPIQNYKGDLTLKVTATFETATTYTFKLTATLHKHLIGADNKRAAVAEDGLTLTAENGIVYTGSVEGGVVTFEALTAGKYTVKAEGYKSQEVTLEAPAQGSEIAQEMTLEFDLVDPATGYDVTQANDGVIKYTATSGEHDLPLNIHPKADEDFFISVNIHKGPDSYTGPDNMRYGFGIHEGDASGAQLNADIIWDSKGFQTLALQMTEWSACWVTNGLPEEFKTAYEKDTGINMYLARLGGVFRMGYELDGIAFDVLRAEGGPVATWTGNVTLSLHTWAANAKGVEYKNLRYEIVKTGAAFADEIFNTRNVVAVRKTVTGATVAMEPATPVMGGDILFTFTPEQGKTPSEVTVNGKDYAGFLGLEEDGTFTLALDNFNEKILTLSATFVEPTETDVKLTVNFHKFGIGDNNIALAPDGTEVTLTSAEEDAQPVTQTVQEGVASFSGVKLGVYTLAAEGCKPATVLVYGAACTATLEFDLADPADGYDVTKMNDGLIKYTATEGDHDLALNIHAKANENFFISANLHKGPDAYVNAEGHGMRYGFGIHQEGKPEAMLNADIVWMNGLYFQITNWVDSPGGAFSEWATAEYEKGTGLSIVLARIEEVFYMGWQIGDYCLIPFGTNQFKDYIGDVSLSLHVWAESAKGVEYRDLHFETAAKGTQFTDPVMAKTFAPIALANYNVMAITNAETWFKGTPDASVFRGLYSADFTNFSAENGSLKWATPDNEIVYYKTNMNHCVFEYTVKAFSIPNNKRLICFSAFFNDAPFVCDIATFQDESGTIKYALRIESHWGWGGYWDNNDVVLSDEQVEALFGEGLAMKIERSGDANFKFDWYVAPSAGEAVGATPMKSFDFNAYNSNWQLPFPTGCGIGVNGAAAEFTNIRITDNG